MKLEEHVSVKVGKNLSRGNEKIDDTLIAYSYDDLTNDLDGLFVDSKSLESSQNHQDEPHLCRYGDVVFSFVSSKAGIVSKANQGKILNQNFAKLIVDESLVDPCYLCYSLNESPSMKKQMMISMQGSTVPKLTPAILKNLELEYPSIETQQLIGKAYLVLRKRQALAKKELDLEKQLYLELLNRLDQQ